MRVPVPPNVRLLWVYCGAAVMLYLPTHGVPFLSDDLTILYRIGVERELGVGSFFRPLGDLTHALNYALTGPRPWAFRLVNLLLLGVCAWAVHRLALRLGERLGPEVAARWSVWSGVLFLLYPFHLEPHIWIVGRGVAMATVAVLFALLAATEGDRGWRVATWTFIGGLCYESALLTPLLLVVLGLGALPQDRTRTLRTAIASLGAVLALFGARLLVHGGITNSYGAAFLQRPWVQYVEQAAVAVARLVIPPVPPSAPLLVLAGLLLVGVVVLVAAWWRHVPLVATRRMLGALLGLMLTASLLGALAGVGLRSSEGDRFLHLASAFACLAIALLISTLQRRWLRSAAMATVVLLSAIALWHGQQQWRSAGALLQRVITAVPQPGAERIVLRGLPGELRGAYVLRHGLREALYFAGRDTSGIIAHRAGMEQRPGERWFQWDGERFVEEVHAAERSVTP